MAKLFNLEIITPERTFYRGEVESVIVNTVGGQMGVLKGNAPLVTALVSGDLKIQKDGKWYHAANSNGFMEVTPEKVIIFCQTVFWPSEMEQSELLDKERRQREAMENAQTAKAYYLAKVSLMRTLAKLSVKYEHENSAMLDR